MLVDFAGLVVRSRQFICLHVFCSHMSACDMFQQDPGQREARPSSACMFSFEGERERERERERESRERERESSEKGERERERERECGGECWFFVFCVCLSDSVRER